MTLGIYDLSKFTPKVQEIKVSPGELMPGLKYFMPADGRGIQLFRDAVL